MLTSAKNSAVHVAAGAGVVLEECDLSSPSFIALTVVNPRTEVLVRKCKLHECQGSGCDVRGGAKAVFEDCRFAGNQNHGVEIYGGARAMFRRCQMNDNDHAGVFLQVSGQAKMEDCTLTANQNGLGVWTNSTADVASLQAPFQPRGGNPHL